MNLTADAHSDDVASTIITKSNIWANSFALSHNKVQTFDLSIE